MKGEVGREKEEIRKSNGKVVTVRRIKRKIKRNRKMHKLKREREREQSGKTYIERPERDSTRRQESEAEKKLNERKKIKQDNAGNNRGKRKR